MIFALEFDVAGEGDALDPLLPFLLRTLGLTRLEPLFFLLPVLGLPDLAGVIGGEPRERGGSGC